MDDLFLKIVSGDIPSAKVYEDEHTFAFLDIRPINKGHTLVIPKTKYRNIFDIDTDTLGKVMAAVQKIAHAQQTALNAAGVTLVMNNEPAGGQEVFHAHIHVIPRFVDDQVFAHPTHVTYDPGEDRAIAQQLSAAL